MYELRAALIIAVLAALVFSVVGHNKPHAQAQRPPPVSSEECSNDPSSDSGLPPCSKPLDNTPPTDTNTDDNTNSESTPTTVQRAQWCRFGNGTFLGLGQTYMHTACAMCQCTTSRAIRCTALQCLPTYCIDNSMPSRKAGHCCAQCSYENNNSTCAYKGLSYPHGVILKSVEDKMQCWCQLGNIECRNYMGSLFQALDIMSDTTAIFIVGIVLMIVVVFGLLLCCGCSVLFYYYYQRNQSSFQQAYDQYLNAAGWQPVEEEEQYEVDASAMEKQLEAEKGPYTSENNEMVPPPYSVADSSNVSAQQEQQK